MNFGNYQQINYRLANQIQEMNPRSNQINPNNSYYITPQFNYIPQNQCLRAKI